MIKRHLMVQIMVWHQKYQRIIIQLCGALALHSNYQFDPLESTLAEFDSKYEDSLR